MSRSAHEPLIAPSVGRARPASWQATRRAETRRRLLDAAVKTFGELGYVGTRVEDILEKAQVGRTSFYKQFRDRLDVVSELFTQFMPNMTQTYLAIRELDRVDNETVSEWIAGLVDAYAESAAVMRLFAEVTAIEPGFSATISHVQTEIISGLGLRFSAFERAAALEEGAQRTRAVLVVETIDHICTMLSLRKAAIDRSAAIEFAAETFLAFVSADAANGDIFVT